MLYYHLRRCGEIGRRAGLKILWSKIRVGSSPTTGTNEKEQPQAAVLCISSPRGVSADAVTCARAKVGERGGKSGAAAKCKEKPREVFASADRGICAPHKPTGTSYLCDFIERRKGREERVAQPRNAKKSRRKFLRVPTGGFVLRTNPPARAVRSRQKLVQHGDSAKCRRNIVGNKPREVFASADRGICASHKPTGTSCIYVILLKGARAERKIRRSREMQRKAARSFCECRQGICACTNPPARVVFM